MDDKEKSFVDELIGASLRNYAGAEPRPGLEGRVLAGVRARQQAARRRTAWAWSMGLAGVAVVVTGLVIYRPRQQPARATRPAETFPRPWSPRPLRPCSRFDLTSESVPLHRDGLTHARSSSLPPIRSVSRKGCS